MDKRNERLAWTCLIVSLAGSCGGGSNPGPVVGTPLADLAPPSATGTSVLPACPSTGTANGVGTWRQMSLQGAPSWDIMYGVWTGSELAVIEPTRQASPVSLNAYDPVLDQWRNIPVPSGLSFTPRTEPFVGAVAGKLIVYGGFEMPSTGAGATDGWVIDLNDLTWTPMAAGPPLFPAFGQIPTVFADGTRAVFVPAETTFVPPSGTTVIAVATYDVSTKVWTTVPPPKSTDGFVCPAPAWNGGLALCGSESQLFTVTSSPLAVTAFPTLDNSLSAESILFAPIGNLFFAFETGPFIADGGGQFSSVNDVFWVDPSRQGWSSSTQVPGVGGSFIATVNGKIVIWGGGVGTVNSAGVPSAPFEGAVYDPVADEWSPVTCAGAPSWPIGGVTVATPTGIIIFGGAGNNSVAGGVLEL